MQALNHEMSTYALVTAGAYTCGAPPWSALVLGLVGTVAADWPDVDAEKSRVNKLLWWAPWFPFALQAVSAIVWEACATAKDRANTVGSWGPAFRVHRGIWHSVWGALLTAGVWYLLLHYAVGFCPAVVQNSMVRFFGLPYPPEVLIAAALGSGMVGHILGDSCTDFGTAPLAPAWYWRGHRYVTMGLWTPMRFKVGKPVEQGLITPLCTGAATWATVGVWVGPWTVWGLYAALAGFAFSLLGVLLGKRKRDKLLGI